MMDEAHDKITNKIIQDIMQSVSYKMQDLINDYPPAVKIIVVAAIQTTVSAIIGSLDEETRNIVNGIVERTEVTVMPDFLDPRRHGK